MCVSAWTPFVLLKDRHGATFQRHRVHHFPFTTHPRILKSKPEVQSFHYPPSLPLIKCSTFGQSIQKYSSNDGVVMNREKLNQKDRFNVWRWEFKKKEKKRKKQCKDGWASQRVGRWSHRLSAIASTARTGMGTQNRVRLVKPGTTLLPGLLLADGSVQPPSIKDRENKTKTVTVHSISRKKKRWSKNMAGVCTRRKKGNGYTEILFRLFWVAE